MFSKLIILSFIVVLSACQATQPPSYQKDRAPEYRNKYNGFEGILQQQKDQNYLMDKELKEKCITAKIDLTIAKTDQRVNDIEKQKELLKMACIP